MIGMYWAIAAARIRNTLSSIITREYKDGVYDRAVVTISQLKTT